MPSLLSRYSIDWPHEYLEYVRLFNERDFFEAHEVLEDLWVVEVAPLKQYYKGLIQWAVALCHWERGNHSGARKLYLLGRGYLESYPGDFEGLNLQSLREDFARLFAPLLGTENPASPARAIMPVLAIRP